jgi:uncharacterized protein DUF5343
MSTVRMTGKAGQEMKGWSMASYPYTSGQAALTQAFAQLRKGGPSKIDAGYLQRFNIAPANESYVISILRFLGLVDEDGSRVEGESDYLFGSDDKFKTGLEKAIRSAYSQLFDEMSDAFGEEQQNLVHWFRAADKTSEVVGKRQASTFLTLGALAGYGDLPVARANGQKTATSAGGTTKKKTAAAAPSGRQQPTDGVADEEKKTSLGNPGSEREFGLSVKVEVNLPSGGDAATYDAIFASIKKHLMS